MVVSEIFYENIQNEFRGNKLRTVLKNGQRKIIRDLFKNVREFPMIV